MSLWGGYPEKKQKMEGLCLAAGLGTPCVSPGGIGPSGLNVVLQSLLPDSSSYSFLLILNVLQRPPFFQNVTPKISFSSCLASFVSCLLISYIFTFYSSFPLILKDCRINAVRSHQSSIF